LEILELQVLLQASMLMAVVGVAMEFPLTLVVTY
jgi:hypothetical protein